MNRCLALVAAALPLFSSFLAAQEAQVKTPAPEQRLQAVESEIQALWSSYYRVVRDELPDTKASLECGSGQYDEIKPTNSFLVFFVSCERIEAEENGYRAEITIGNPHTFGFTRVNGTLSYGDSLTTALVNEKQRVPFSTSNELRSGTWTRIGVSIARAEMKDLQKVIVEFQITGASARLSGAPIRQTDAPQLGMLRPE